jgi:hypothetical protein
VIVGVGDDADSDGGDGAAAAYCWLSCGPWPSLLVPAMMCSCVMEKLAVP